MADRIEIHEPATLGDPAVGTSYQIDGEEVDRERFLQVLRERREPQFAQAQWLHNGGPTDPELVARSHGVD